MNARSTLGRLDKLSSEWLIGLFRILLGVLWLANLEWKRPPDFGQAQGNGLYKYVDSAVRLPVNPQFASFIENVVIPNYKFFGWMTLLMEAALAALLMCGWHTRLMGLLGAGLSVNILLSVLFYDKAYEWPWSYYLMIGAHLAVFAIGAGKHLGIDGARVAGGKAIEVGLIAMGAVGMVVGIVSFFVVRNSATSWSDSVLVGINRWELKVLWFNQTSALLTVLLSIALIAAGVTRLRILAWLPIVAFLIMCVMVCVQWRSPKTGALGGTGATLGFWMMMVLGPLGLVLPRRLGRSSSAANLPKPM